MKKVKLDLFDLKNKDDLISVKEFFSKSTKHWFNEDGSPKKEYFEKASCPLCSADKSSELYRIDGFSYHRCSECHSIYTRPHLKAGVLEKLYTDGTYKHYQDNLVRKGTKLRKGLLEQRKFWQVKELWNHENVSLLDVGCGRGTFLEVCKENGWQVEGVDPSTKSLSDDRIKIRQGDFNKMTYTQKFDVITFWGVLEHMPDPIKAVSKATSLLNKSGLIVFEVPSANCFLSEYLQRTVLSPTRYIESGRHNIFFSKRLIEKIAKDFSLEISLLETNGLDIQTIFLEQFDPAVTESILNIQDTLNDLLLGDHYRVFLKKQG